MTGSQPEEQFDALRKQLENQRLPQALLLCGSSRNENLWQFAIQVASLFFCEAPIKGCGECIPCRQVQKDEHRHVQAWPEDGLIKSEAVLAMAEHLEVRVDTYNSSFARRVVVVSQAENLTTASANKLLKLLEEPPDSAQLIFTSARTQSIPKTLLSRMAKWRLKFPLSEVSEDESLGNLVKVALTAENSGAFLTAVNGFGPFTRVNWQDFLFAMEVELNKLYKTMPKADFQVVAGRRNLLRQVKQAANQNIHINKKLILETIFHLDH